MARCEEVRGRSLALEHVPHISPKWAAVGRIVWIKSVNKSTEEGKLKSNSKIETLGENLLC